VYASHHFSAWFFLLVSAAQISIWAMKKHRALKKEFGNEIPKSRKALFPFVW
jgi:very-long-chain enoyl-CoA reductase